jgi:4-hydroxythreonine-4-phosphate dehydrogenase
MARLAVVMGDPTGIGPEVLARALGGGLSDDVLLIGDADVWADAQESSGVRVGLIPADRPGAITGGGVPFLHLPPQDRTWTPGTMSPAAGRASARWLEEAVRLALGGAADAIIFAPLNKQAIIRAGYRIRDEYELCAQLAGVDDHDEMNVIPHPAVPGSGRLLWVARVTGHRPFREVSGHLTRERILRTIRLAQRVAARTSPTPPSIGVAALNPHAGEGGLLGDEEERLIRPAIADALGDGIRAAGPIPADHVFRQARAGQFDVVVAMYHDQAQIATKLLGFEMGVSVGVGYPFVMTTPSHGTAFDIVGRGVADARPMRQALTIAARLATRVEEERAPGSSS